MLTNYTQSCVRHLRCEVRLVCLLLNRLRMPSSRGKVLMAMSGGVDSSVGAGLLLREGYEVIGCFMRLGSPGESLDQPIPADGPAVVKQCAPTKIGKQGCCSINDAADARQVAAQLNVPFYVCNFKKDFGRIMDYFAGEYAAGRTPNPCVRCNDWLKFGKLHDYAKQLDCDFVASGHYARVETGDRESAVGSGGSERSHLLPIAESPFPSLLRGIDEDKDQSYVLFGVPRDRLSHMLLPIGGLRKPRVRELAQEMGLPVFDKPDSQEICFVPDNDYASLVGQRRPEVQRTGEFIDQHGHPLGEHQGQHQFTIGQRRGLGVALGHPIYVVHKNAATNTVTLGPRELLLTNRCVAGEANWLIDPASPMASALQGWTRCWAQHRYNASPTPAMVRVIDSANPDVPNYSGRAGRFEVRFDEPQEAVAPGQAIVIFGEHQGNGAPTRVLGGGWIESAATTSND